MKDIAGKRILIIQQRNWGQHVGHYLACRLSQEGAKLAAVTFKKTSHEFHASQKDVQYESLVSNDAVLENPEIALKGRRFAMEEITRELGVQSVWPLVAVSRDISRSYGEAFYYAHRQQMTDEDIRLYLQAVYAYTRDLFDQFKPDAIVAPLFSEVAHLMLYHMGRARGIKPVSVVDSKVRGVWIATHSPCEDEGAFYDRVDDLNKNAESPNADRARRYIEEFRESFKRPTYAKDLSKTDPLLKRVRSMLAPYRTIAEWYVKGSGKGNYVKPLGPTVDWRPPHIVLRDYYTKAWWARAARSFAYAPLERVEKYVYYPLQVEPEVTLDVFAPYFTNQLELARLVAMSLPDDYTLVVKDHPAMMGLRSPEYLRAMARTPNVTLVDSRISNETLLKRASLVVAPNSTALVEAAFYNVPTIQFGNQGTTQKAPNVVKHTDLTTLAGKIRERLSAKLKGEQYERRLRNFVAAAYDTGREIDYVAAWERGEAREREKIWSLYRSGLERIMS